MEYSANEAEDGAIVEVIDVERMTRPQLRRLFLGCRTFVRRMARPAHGHHVNVVLECRVVPGTEYEIDVEGEHLAGAVDLALEDLVRVLKSAGVVARA